MSYFLICIKVNEQYQIQKVNLVDLPFYRKKFGKQIILEGEDLKELLWQFWAQIVQEEEPPWN